MTSDEVLTALRCCASDNCDGCPLWDDDPEDTTCADGLIDSISKLPAADVAPVVHGSWGTHSDRPDSLI